MKNILVTTDFSDNAYCALFFVTNLLATKPCTFYILNTYSEISMLQGKSLPPLGCKKYLQQLEVDSNEQLTHIKHKIVLDNDNPQHHFEVISQKGDLAKIIVEKIETLQIDLVTMGNKGLTEAADIFFGSNTIKVANTITQCPVLAIPGELDFKPIKEIAYVTDFKKSCNQNTLAPLLYLATLCNAAIRVMHITEKEILNETQEFNRKQIGGFLEDVEHSFHWMQNFDDKAKVIDIFLEKFKVDMYTMVNQKRGIIEKLTKEPIIKDISMYSHIPFLILPPRD